MQPWLNPAMLETWIDIAKRAAQTNLPPHRHNLIRIVIVYLMANASQV
jgi:hypothetical protein